MSAVIPGSSIQERVKMVEGELRELVQAHEAGTYPEGAEALSAKITSILKEAKLIEVRTNVQVDNVGVHPSNRGDSGLVPFDVHGLLFETFFENGYNEEKWGCVAITTPPKDKEAWLEINMGLNKKSNGLLPPISDMELATGRGSYGIAALRACKVPTLSSNPDIADHSGHVSLHKIIDRQPSMRIPLERGVPIKVLRGEVEEAVPGLFKVISRAGNVTNSQYRYNPSILQEDPPSCRPHGQHR